MYNWFLVDSIAWDFDDPNSGLANIDTNYNATHVFTAPGVYTVQLFTYNSSSQDALTHMVEIIDLPTVSLPNNISFCDGDTFNVAAISNQQNYVWSTGDTTQSIEVFSQGVYSVTTSNVCGTASDSVEVEVHPTPLVDLGADTISSPIGVPVVLESNGSGSSCSWSTGQTSSSISVSNGGTYYLTVTTLNGCEASDSIYIFFYIGIDEETARNDFNIFPNPASQKLHIISKEKIEGIKIYTASGQMVRSILLNDFSAEINIRDLSEGVYYMKSESSSGFIHLKHFLIIR